MEIELIFKALKSSFDFDKFGKAGEAYFKCLFYGKLIVVLLTMRIFSICRAIKFREKKCLISIQKFIKQLRNCIKFLAASLIKPNKSNFKTLENKIKSISERSIFDKRRRKTTEEVLQSCDLPECVLIMLVS